MRRRTELFDFKLNRGFVVRFEIQNCTQQLAQPLSIGR